MVATTYPAINAVESARSSTARFYHPELERAAFFRLPDGLPAPRVSSRSVVLDEAGRAVVFWRRNRCGSRCDGCVRRHPFLRAQYLHNNRVGVARKRSCSRHARSKVVPTFGAFCGSGRCISRFLHSRRLARCGGSCLGSMSPCEAGVWFSFLAGNWFIVFHGFPSSVIFPLWSRFNRGAVLHYVAGGGAQSQ